MAAGTHHEEGPVRVLPSSLVAPRGTWSLLAIGGARCVRMEPDVSWVQGIFLVAIVATAVALKGWWNGSAYALPFGATALALFVGGFLAARKNRPCYVLLIEHDGATIEVWRSFDEAAVQRTAAAIEKARPQQVRAS